MDSTFNIMYVMIVMLSVKIRDIAIKTVKNVDCRWIIHNISKSEAITLLKTSVLEDRRYIFKNIALDFSLFKAVVYYLLCLAYI